MAPGSTLLGACPSKIQLTALNTVAYFSLPFAQCLEAKPPLTQLSIPAPARQTLLLASCHQLLQGQGTSSLSLSGFRRQ